MKVVSKRLGHSSIAITGDIYSHVRAEADQVGRSHPRR
jgi:integrase